MKIDYYYGNYGKIEMTQEKKLNTCEFYSPKTKTGFVYILNIKGSDVCKIGKSKNVFERINSIRQVVKCVFPYIENSINYQVFISQPLINYSTIETTMHNYYDKFKIDNEWFNCEFNNAILNLKQYYNECVDQRIDKHINSMLENENYYSNYIFDNKFLDLQHKKPLSILEFSKYIAQNHNFIFEYELNDTLEIDRIINALNAFIVYVRQNKNNIVNQYRLNKNQYNTYLSSSIKYINEFIEEISEGVKNND